ncbi:hypothetical protein SERRSCBI_20130 [Serratia sp. SCBI]|nr:hypothetical protein SERRSCBI_20130 [Serratia sp. SCBI]
MFTEDAMSHTRYETDVVAWANEQAALLRSGKLSEIDIEKIAEEIEDVGKSEQRELASRMTVLIAHLLKWKYQPARRGTSWERTIKAQRKEVLYSLKESPSLKGKLSDADWLDVVWSKAVALATAETGLDVYPENGIWETQQILSQTFYPD